MTPRVTAPQPTASATEKLIAVLEATRAKLMTRAQPEHRFRFVSAAQSRPYAMAYALWIKNGEVGTQPMARPRKCAPPSMTKGNPLRNCGLSRKLRPSSSLRRNAYDGVPRHDRRRFAAPSFLQRWRPGRRTSAGSRRIVTLQRRLRLGALLRRRDRRGRDRRSATQGCRRELTSMTPFSSLDSIMREGAKPSNASPCPQRECQCFVSKSAGPQVRTMPNDLGCDRCDIADPPSVVAMAGRRVAYFAASRAPVPSSGHAAAACRLRR
jgi:hypothetical protein